MDRQSVLSKLDEDFDTAVVAMQDVVDDLDNLNTDDDIMLSARTVLSAMNNLNALLEGRVLTPEGPQEVDDV